MKNVPVYSTLNWCGWHNSLLTVGEKNNLKTNEMKTLGAK